MNDESREHRAKVFDAMVHESATEEDGWKPTDDPDEWESDGLRRSDPTEDRLRWSFTTPAGLVVERDHTGERFTTRRDAIVFIGAPCYACPSPTWKKLLDLSHEVAGWAKIEFDGWIIQPVKPDA